MYVRFVGVENALPVQQTHAGHAHKIENRHGQQGDDHRHAVRARSQHHGVVHRVFDGQISQGVAQHQTPGIAHESLGASTLRAEDVEEEKGHHGSDQAERHEGVGFDPQLPKQGRETAQSEHRQAARQAVDTVDQVHRIHDEEAQEDRQHAACPKGDFPQAEQAVEVVDIQATERHESRSGQLHRELNASTQAQKIIEHTDEVNEEQPGHEYHGRQPKHRQLRTLDTHPQVKVTGHDADGHRGSEK